MSKVLLSRTSYGLYIVINEYADFLCDTVETVFFSFEKNRHKWFVWIINWFQFWQEPICWIHSSGSESGMQSYLKAFCRLFRAGPDLLYTFLDFENSVHMFMSITHSAFAYVQINNSIRHDYNVDIFFNNFKTRSLKKFKLLNLDSQD